MKLEFREPNEHCYKAFPFPSRTELANRAQCLPSDPLFGERAHVFFREIKGDYRLDFVEEGSDSTVYLFREIVSGRCGLLKVFLTERHTSELIGQYRDLTQRAIDHLPEINDALKTSVELDGYEFQTEIDIVPIQEPFQSAGLTGAFIEGENWILGDSIGGWKSQFPETMSVEDILEESAKSRLYTLPLFRSVHLGYFSSKVQTVIEKVTGANKLSLQRLNMKAKIDRCGRKFKLIITDLAADILDIQFPDNLK